MSILGLSRAAHRRKGESVDDILQQDPPIQQDIVEAISYKRIDEYSRFIEEFLREDFRTDTFGSVKTVERFLFSTHDAKHALNLWKL